jgi:hypothetical protein
MRTNLLSKSVPRVELDQRSREARLRIARIERLLVPRAARGPPNAQRPPPSDPGTPEAAGLESFDHILRKA